MTAVISTTLNFWPKTASSNESLLNFKAWNTSLHLNLLLTKNGTPKLSTMTSYHRTHQWIYLCLQQILSPTKTTHNPLLEVIYLCRQQILSPIKTTHDSLLEVIYLCRQQILSPIKTTHDSLQEVIYLCCQQILSPTKTTHDPLLEVIYLCRQQILSSTKTTHDPLLEVIYLCRQQILSSTKTTHDPLLEVIYLCRQQILRPTKTTHDPLLEVNSEVDIVQGAQCAEVIKGVLQLLRVQTQALVEALESLGPGLLHCGSVVGGRYRPDLARLGLGLLADLLGLVLNFLNLKPYTKWQWWENVVGGGGGGGSRERRRQRAGRRKQEAEQEWAGGGGGGVSVGGGVRSMPKPCISHCTPNKRSKGSLKLKNSRSFTDLTNLSDILHHIMEGKHWNNNLLIELIKCHF